MTTISNGCIAIKRVSFNPKCKLRILRSPHDEKTGTSSGTTDSTTTTTSSTRIGDRVEDEEDKRKAPTSTRWYSRSELQNCQREAAKVIDLARREGISYIERCSKESILGLEIYMSRKHLRNYANRKQETIENVLDEQDYHRAKSGVDDGSTSSAFQEEMEQLIALASVSVSKTAQREANRRATRLRREVLRWQTESAKTEWHASVTTCLEHGKNENDCNVLPDCVVKSSSSSPTRRRCVAPGAA
jgi:hypothetical protein